MKKQYGKKINPITNNLNVSDDVLIENSCTKRSKGGQSQNKWIGPYSITKVSNISVHISRNNRVQRVKKSMVRLWKEPDLPQAKQI